MLTEKTSASPYPVATLAPLHTRSIRLEIFENEQVVGEAAAAFVAAQVQQKPDSVLLLPTGRTPLLMYSGLVARVQRGELRLNRIQTFNLDEFHSLPADHPGNYRSYMRRVFFEPAGIPAQNTHLLDSAAPDPLKECATYEGKIRAAGGIDLVVLGIGANGHIGFNEPGSSLTSRTRLVAIQPETRMANAFLFEAIVENVPEAALTVGIGTIMEARKVLLLATGVSKAEAVSAMLSGPVTPDLPASYLRLHPNVTLLADQEACAATI
jgi:glucosamine-6-phosphate deaminase